MKTTHAQENVGLFFRAMIALFGKNWRTTVGGLGETICGMIFILAVLPKETWDDMKVWLPLTLLAFAKTWKDLHMRDKGVSSVDMGLQDVEPKSQAIQVVTPADDP